MTIYNPYAGSSSTEADLRKEVHDMFFGNDYEIAKAHSVLFRRMRRDEDDKLIPCECVDSLTNEALPKCPSCLSEGYLWDETWVKTRKVDVGSTVKKLVLRNMHLAGGVVDVDTVVYYFEYSIHPTWYDRIVEMVHDNEGNPVIPYRRWKIHKPQTVIDLRSDRGRIEFYAVFVSQKNSIQLLEDAYGK